MVMSVGVCECGCSEFGHDVGGHWDELGQPEYEGWQQHRCTKECLRPCLVARCRDGFDGDGFWVWCRECDIQCSGSYEEWSDEANEDGVKTELTASSVPQRGSGWEGLRIGSKVQVNFTDELFTLTGFAVISESGDAIRLASSQTPNNHHEIFSAFGVGRDEFEILIDLKEIVRHCN